MENFVDIIEIDKCYCISMIIKKSVSKMFELNSIEENLHYPDIFWSNLIQQIKILLLEKNN